MKSAVDWFEIPVEQLSRAVSFYEALLATRLKPSKYGPFEAAVFSVDDPGIGGALVQDKGRKAQQGGTRVYLCATGMLEEVLSRVAPAGGSVLLPKTDLGEPGYIAVIRDSEGNEVGLHSERV